MDAVFKLLYVEVARKATDRKKYIYIFWTVLQFLNTNRMGFVEFRKIILDFAQEKGIVIKF